LENKTEMLCYEEIERIKQEAFMDGYKYAIEVLKDNIIAKESSNIQNSPG